MAPLPSPLEVNLPGRLLARTGFAVQIPGANLRLGEIAFTKDDNRFWIGDESSNPPWVITSKTTGDIDWTGINPTFKNINVSTINGKELSDFFSTTIINSGVVITVINQAITKTVYGPGADFADLNAAYAWLSQRAISSLGSVTLVLPAAKIPVTQSLNLTHPNGGRISIIGAALQRSLPAMSSLQVTGNSIQNQQTDSNVNLATLRNCFSTELVCTNGAQINISSDLGIMQDVLITGNQSLAPGAFSSSGIVINNGLVQLKRVVVNGFQTIGVQGSGCYVIATEYFLSFNNGYIGMSFGSGSILTVNATNGASIGSLSNGSLYVGVANSGGILAAYGSVLYAIAPVNSGQVYSIYSLGNIGHGIMAQSSSAGSLACQIYSSMNTQAGVLAASNSVVNTAGQFAVNISNNGGYGFLAYGLSFIECTNAVVSGSPYAFSAQLGAQINRAGASATATVAVASPAVGSVGNSNSLIS